ncbi:MULTISPECIES: hypothetical protein [unclassified Microcoleus]|uniref:hypothetical protein n=1 Tax=unclassified Microcoleus TaxID=2642155 RepID=UPI0026012BCB|nr:MULTISPECIES: hypothetical protein [unclassified Microcoleus]
MTYLNPTRRVPRKRLHAKRILSPEEIAQWYAERAAFRQRCQPIFDRLKPELIKTHYNWYMAVEPDSGEHFIEQDSLAAGKMCRQKHPNAIPHVFRINETGVCGTI